MTSLLNSQSELLTNLNVKSEIDSGRAFVEILNHSRKAKADSIVVGARGLADIEQVVAGSTVENLVRRAPCSALVVR